MFVKNKQKSLQKREFFNKIWKKLKKSQKTLKKVLTNREEFSIMIERLTGKDENSAFGKVAIRSLKIEQHEISSTEKCERSR